jgi:hypothetical protein
LKEEKMKKRTTRLYIDVYCPVIDNPYELARKMNELVESKLPTYYADLRMGSFKPAKRTNAFYEYEEMVKALLGKRERGEDEDALLEQMDDVWWKMPDEERKILDRYYKKKEVILPPTRFKYGQVIDSGPDTWQVIHIEENKMTIKVIKTGPDKHGHIGSYLDIGAFYDLFRHEDDLQELWEVHPEMMKRDTSQVLLYWFKEDDAPVIDLDF